MTMSGSPPIDCACGHEQRDHARGVGGCSRCGCDAPHRKRGGRLEILAELEPGKLSHPQRAPLHLVRCPECGREYPTRAWARDLVRRRQCRPCADGMRRARAWTRRAPRAPRPGDLPPPSAFADRPHGTRVRYVAGCRCGECREANNAYERARGKLRRAGLGNPLVSAARARAHLVRLSAAGVGRRTVEDISGVVSSSLGEIRSGRKTQIRRETETRILAVTRDATHSAKLVDAAATWRRVARLLEAGYTRGAIALALGRKTPSLQIRRDKVTARTALALERLERKLLS